ncbi:Aste57867_16457 [Aphanomyces stellatus]|uniref:Aste57867_16457 protein n=1 Tax=Aphanomyces stellatus TaxID=120398 RepID=A0A485L6R1_9STRA|nr:hypothetical protein As57867_016400 [Aphanomyces stellatus]VFT93231.1 Aste57867_16457 [Aphanomyces stellatus]
MVSPSTVPTEPIAKRAYERQRKRRYRAEQRNQIELCRAHVVQLQEELSRRLAAHALSPHQGKSVAPSTLVHDGHGGERLRESLALLRRQVKRRAKLLHMLYTWVAASLQPPPSSPDLVIDMGANAPWLHSTLLADPVARHCGIQWLTDRVFHSAMAQHAIDDTVEDVLELKLLTMANADYFVGMETRRQTTYFANLADVGHGLWTLFTGTKYSPASQVESIDVVDAADGSKVTYKRIQDLELGTNMIVLRRRYDLGDRIVFVHVYLRNDDCVPQAPHEMRPYGFGWVIAQAIAPEVTLVRGLTIQYTPETTAGPISLDRMAAMFGVEATTPQATLARIEENALRNYEARQIILSTRLTDAIRASGRQKYQPPR